jgi:hypothetical protein
MNGPSGSGTAGPGAYSRRVGPGDIIIIPNKVAHGWSGVTDHIEYLSYRPDPDRVLPAGWVYPLLLKTTPPEVPTPGVGRGNAAGRGRAAPRTLIRAIDVDYLSRRAFVKTTAARVPARLFDHGSIPTEERRTRARSTVEALTISPD